MRSKITKCTLINKIQLVSKLHRKKTLKLLSNQLLGVFVEKATLIHISLEMLSESCYKNGTEWGIKLPQ